MDIHIRFGSVVVSTFGKQSFAVFNFHFYEHFLVRFLSNVATGQYHCLATYQRSKS